MQLPWDGRGFEPDDGTVVHGGSYPGSGVNLVLENALKLEYGKLLPASSTRRRRACPLGRRFQATDSSAGHCLQIAATGSPRTQIVDGSAGDLRADRHQLRGFSGDAGQSR